MGKSVVISHCSMNIESILAANRTFCHIAAGSKKKAIERAATLIAGSAPSLDADEIYTNLIAREKLGPTALGNGIALPHCRLAGCTDIIAALFTMETAIEFGAMDDLPIDIMFVLLVPEQEVDHHLKAMAMLASKLDSEDYRKGLITAKNNQMLFERAIRDVSNN
jgi:PTS system nitrogen regulatory IIA component